MTIRAYLVTYCHGCSTGHEQSIDVDDAQLPGPLPEGWTHRAGVGHLCPSCSLGPVRSCVVCGCTEARSCRDVGRPCHWILSKPDVCSSCRIPADALEAYDHPDGVCWALQPPPYALEGQTGYRCSLVAGHSDNHRAVDPDRPAGPVLAVWPAR